MTLVQPVITLKRHGRPSTRPACFTSHSADGTTGSCLRDGNGSVWTKTQGVDR